MSKIEHDEIVLCETREEYDAIINFMQAYHNKADRMLIWAQFGTKKSTGGLTKQFRNKVTNDYWAIREKLKDEATSLKILHQIERTHIFTGEELAVPRRHDHPLNPSSPARMKMIADLDAKIKAPVAQR
jgi:hypothetical protein